MFMMVKDKIMKKILRYLIFGTLGIIVFPAVWFLTWLLDDDDLPKIKDYLEAFNL